MLAVALAQQTGVALALGAALAQQADIFVGALLFVVFGQSLCQGTHVGFEHGVVGHGAVQGYEIFRGGEGQMAAVGGQDAAAHRLYRVFADGLFAVFLGLDVLLKKLQIHHPCHSRTGYQQENHIDNSDFDGVLLHSITILLGGSTGA